MEEEDQQAADGAQAVEVGAVLENRFVGADRLHWGVTFRLV
jgi:hypothetical protein